MDGSSPANVSHRTIDLIATVAVAALIWAALPHAVAATTIDIAVNGPGSSPAQFEFGLTGYGPRGQWTVVSDPTAVARTAIEHVSRDLHEDRYPLAIYNPLSLKNVAVAVRFKIVAGTMQTAGIAVRLADERHYYAVVASALDSRVDFYRVVDGKLERVAGIDADVFTDHWQTLAVTAEDDRFTVSLDTKQLFTAWDRTFLSDGRIGLLTQDDNVTRFDQVEITPLPWSARR
jgi:hypothetical protein